jgi:multicomponent Na+:H+ antiporter subunit B
MRAPRCSAWIAVCIVGAFVALVSTLYLASPPDPAASDRYLSRELAETGASNRVAGIYLNYRLFDTLLEILVFSVAVLGVFHYLHPSDGLELPPLSESAVVSTAAGILCPVAFLLSMLFAVYGHLSPGGGFAAGVIAASALLYVAIAQGMKATQRQLGPQRLAFVEKLVLLAILGWTLVPMLLGRAPLSDPLPVGTPGRLLSGGSILLYNLLIATKVFLGAWVAIAAFAKHRGDL